jgi:hypothetical protein
MRCSYVRTCMYIGEIPNLWLGPAAGSLADETTMYHASVLSGQLPG